MAKCSTCGKFLSAKGAKDGAAAGSCKCCIEKPSRNKDKSPLKELHVRTRASPLDLNVPDTGYEDARGSPLLVHQQSQYSAGASPLLDVAQEMRLFRAELREMRDEVTKELRDLRREVGDLRRNIADCEARVDSLLDRVSKLETHQASSEDLEKTVRLLKVELNDRDQELLSSDLEISNLPEEKGESSMHLVELVARKLGVQLESRDIVFAERVGPQFKQSDPTGTERTSSSSELGEAGRPRRLVVRLARRHLRDELLRSARVRRGATSADIGLRAPARRFFLNERLNKQNKMLFYRVRQAASRLGWKYAWTKRGRILTRQSEGKRIYTILNDEDLQRVFGSDALDGVPI